MRLAWSASMSVQIECPKCQKKLKIEDNLLGKNIKCPACAAVFAVKAPASSTTAAVPPPARTDPEPPRKAVPPPDDDEDEAPRRPDKAAPKARDDDEDDRPAKPAAKKSRNDDDDYDDRPKKSSAKRAQDDDEDDRPKKAAAKKGRDDDDDDRPKKSAAKKGRDWGDDDDDDRPSKKEKKKGSGGKVLLIVGTLVLLLCGGCFGVGYYIYVKIGEGVDVVRGAMTDAQARMTGPEFQVPTSKQGPVIPGSDTRKAPGDTGKKAEDPKPADDKKFASEQQIADAMVDNSEAAMKLYVPQPLQLTGVVTRVTTGPRNRVNEIFFEPLVEDPKTKQKIKFPINCRLAQVVPLPKATVGATVTVRGNLTGGGKDSATLNDCVIISTEPAKPGAGVDPAKPNDQFPVVSPEDLANDLNENQQVAYNRYFGKPLKIDGGVVSKQEKNPDGSISAVVFEVQVKDKKTGAMKPFLITCKLGSPIAPGGLAADLYATGKTVTVRGKLGAVIYIDRKATVTDCASANPGPEP
jgi:hypothetical protein